jgi:hypothetical protein
VNHGQNWKGWERSGEKGLIISDNQVQTCLIITINDTSTGDLPLIITISDTCKNQTKRIDFDDTFNLPSLIVSLGPNGGNSKKKHPMLWYDHKPGDAFGGTGVHRSSPIVVEMETTSTVPPTQKTVSGDTDK